MSFAVLCQTKGLGSSFQCAAHTWMASVSAATDSKLPLQSRRLVRCAAYLGVMDRLSSELLGFAPDARVLIVNCDDFGMHDAVNAAVVESIENGIASSCSLMVPCPAAADAMRLLRERPHIPFGIHLALIRDSPEYRWGPAAAKADVPSLLDPDTDELYVDTPAQRTALLAEAKLTDVERELRAQIDAVVDVGLAPTHLDWHCLADGGRADILDLAMALAKEYGLAARVWLDDGRRVLAAAVQAVWLAWRRYRTVLLPTEGGSPVLGPGED